MDWKAKWIWQAGEAAPRNFYWCARRAFDLEKEPCEVKAHITADSRYVLWINGHLIGQGPVRAFTHRWRYDTYDVSPYVKAGENVVAILVQHFGHSTFQYLEARGGLLAQVECDGEVVVATDSTWRGKSHSSYSRDTERISCQQGWVEHFDARVEPAGWTSVGYDDSDWERAVLVGEAGCEPWSSLLPRGIPFLTDQPLYPERLMRARTVKPPKQVWSVDLKPNLLPGDLSANRAELPGLLAVVLVCDEPVRVSISTYHNVFRALRIDGNEVPWETAASGLKLDKGEHLLVVNASGCGYHEWSATLIFEHEGDALSLKSPMGDTFESAFVTIGPFSPDEKDDLESAVRLPLSEQIAAHPKAKPVSQAHISVNHVAALTALATPTNDSAKIIQSEAMLVGSEDYTTIMPPSGGDIELLLDFGKEIVGFVELELCAPKGVVIDFHGFEYMEDGPIQWPGAGLNNVFRYTTRSGWQRWRSIVRRGFRYASFTIRFPMPGAEPVRIRSVRCLLNIYPYTECGLFKCSDALLNRIWDISKWTVRLCSEDTFVDCPAYEQTFWVGDARNESLFSYTAFGDYRLARRSLLLAAESLYRSPLIESQVPSGWQIILTAWSLLWTIACEEYYQFTADRAFLEEIYPAVQLQNSNILSGFMNSKGLFEIDAWNMLDWAPMDTPDSGVVTHQNTWLVEALRRSAKMADLLGKHDDASTYRQQADALKTAINTHLWDEGRQGYLDCIHKDGTPSPTFSQQTQTVAYLCDIVPDGRRDLFEKYLTQVPDGWVKVGSPFMMAFTIEALARTGNTQAILDLIRENWGRMIEYGATTCWETFEKALSERWPTRSHCHAWSAVPAYALPTYVLGVRPIDAGFKRFEISPCLADLDFARGYVPTPYGQIDIHARKDDGAVVIKFSVPPGTVAVSHGTEYGAGRHETRHSA
ncbi:MAG: glycoside hydrolase family 78 protein [Armatimonadetes bacterium]|nr:glycoside hydrolase family 78 protein [Armatimonadota bacterium]